MKNHFSEIEAMFLNRLGVMPGDRIIISERDIPAETARGYVPVHTDIYKDSVVILEDVWAYGTTPEFVEITFRRLRKRDGRPFKRTQRANYNWLHGVSRAVCPDCGSERVRSSDGRIECLDCGRLFDTDDIRWQEVRNGISGLLADTDEEHPLVFPAGFMPILGECWPDTVGLSSLDLPLVEKAFQVPGDGTIWVHVYGEYDRETGDPAYHDIEEVGFIDQHDLENILDSLKRIS